MGDNPITDDNNVVLYDDLGNKVGVILDGSIYRLAVDSKVVPDENPYKTTGVPVHAYYDGNGNTTLSTYTVATGKVLYVYGWGFSARGAKSYLELQINGTDVDKMYQEDSSHGQRGQNNVRYTIPIEVTAGQTVRIYRVGGDTGKYRATLIEGILYDA